MRKILAAKPSITEREVEYVQDAIRNGWGNKCYDYLIKFENAFKHYQNSPFGIATSSCTGALHIAFASMGLRKGDEVIVPDITWIASVSPIVQLGATPVFVDIERDSWCIDPQSIETAITASTKAILVVHVYGNLVDMDAVMAIAKKYNLLVIEDAAEALGSEYKGKKAGSIGDFGVFSFHGTKTMTTGEGGMLISNNKNLFAQVSIIANHGRDPAVPKLFWCEQIGLKYKMSNLQASVGLAQLERVDELVTHKRWVFNNYKGRLKSADIEMNIEKQQCKNSYWMPTVILPKSFNLEKRDTLIQTMINQGIQVRPFFYPLSGFPMFEKCIKNRVSLAIFERGINLPSYFEMTVQDIDYVSNTLIETITNLTNKVESGD
jgi:perosamine synthetase